MASIASRITLTGGACLLAGCAGWQALPDQATTQLPAPDPLRKFVASIDAPSGSKPSPDGRKLLWHALYGRDVTTFVRAAEGGDAAVFRLGRTLPYWACDSRHLIHESDPEGGGNTQVVLIDTDRPGATPVNLTPWKGSASHVIHAGDPQSGKLVLVSNRRDTAVFDVYTADPATGKVDMVWKNNGDVTRWIMDVDGSVGARVRRQDGQYFLQVLGKASNTWKSVSAWPEMADIRPIRVDRAAGSVFVMSRLSADAAGATADTGTERGLPCRMPASPQGLLSAR
ncbi:hypothetical protein [Noviherbaspirillum denitrificans]|uniref:Lipoprotein LpqB beta-propeller domain-containing protein n=1 Tax=Noviherbaspirillum denitrificans TaxID=1968433 RepID=A0A254TKI4_9BURK|nr:hypothetical protein [Noviherbaspirillum denitrificans]OWW21113.1 hypothetical protein AYR66_18160 [Noviherbaspirillum denitrificans]